MGLVAWAGTIVMCLNQLMMMKHGGGRNQANVPEEQFNQFPKIFLAFQRIGRIAIFFAKLSILLLYLRIFFPLGRSRTIFWWVIQVVIWLNFLHTVALILVTVRQCIPFGLPWGSSGVNQSLVLIFATIINIISVIAILLIPLGSVWRLQMGKKKRWACWVLFGFGTMAPLAASIARLGYQVATAKGENKTVTDIFIALLATAEQVVAINFGSAPVAIPWVVRKVGKTSRSQQPNPGRLWLNRGTMAADGHGKRRSTGPAHPFLITRATIASSEENLRPYTAGSRSEQEDHGPGWELSAIEG